MSIGLRKRTSIMGTNPYVENLVAELEKGKDGLSHAFSVIISSIHDEKATISDFVAFGLCDYLLQFLSDADPAFVCESINFVSQLYSFSTPDDRELLADYGIPEILITKLSEDDGDVIFCSLTALQQIVSADTNERDRIYGSEIWPSLSDLFNNFTDDPSLLLPGAILLNSLLMPPHHVEVSKVVEIIDSILHVEEYYLDSLPQNPDQIDETSQDSWTLFLRLLAPISVFLNDGFSDGFFESSILPFSDRILPLLLQGVSRLRSAAALKGVSLMFVLSAEARKQLLESGILEVFSELPFERCCDDRTRFQMWCVVNCLGSIAAGNEEDVAMVIDSAMWKRLVTIMEDERLNWGLLTEFVYLVSNLVFSGTNEQRQRIVDSGCMRVLNAMMKASGDENVRNLAAGTIGLLSDNQIEVDPQDVISVEHPDECAGLLLPYP